MKTDIKINEVDGNKKVSVVITLESKKDLKVLKLLTDERVKPWYLAKTPKESNTCYYLCKELREKFILIKSIL